MNSVPSAAYTRWPPTEARSAQCATEQVVGHGCLEMFIQWVCQLSQVQSLLRVLRLFDQPKVGQFIEGRPPLQGCAWGPNSPES